MNSFVVYDPVIDLKGLKPGEIDQNVRPACSSIEPPEVIDNVKENEGGQESESKDDLAEKIYHPQAVTDSSGRTSTGDEEWDDLINLIIPPKGEKKEGEPKIAKELTLEEVYNEAEDDSVSCASSESDDEDENVTQMNYEKLNWVQFVSKAQSSREELEELNAKVESQLGHRQARLTGLCEVRADIYDELFTEILRQVLINMPERGILLSKVQNEAKMKLEAYEMLVSRSFSYGVEKLVEASHGLQDLKDEVKQLEDKDKSLETSIKEIEDKISYHTKDIVLQKEARQFARDKELEYLRHYQDNLSRFIKSITEDEE